jgi:hypothetical protein
VYLFELSAGHCATYKPRASGYELSVVLGIKRRNASSCQRICGCLVCSGGVLGKEGRNGYWNGIRAIGIWILRAQNDRVEEWGRETSILKSPFNPVICWITRDCYGE